MNPSTSPGLPKRQVVWLNGLISSFDHLHKEHTMRNIATQTDTRPATAVARLTRLRITTAAHARTAESSRRLAAARANLRAA